MFSLALDGTPTLRVRSRHGVSQYAMDGSAPNPLEAALASLAACAGVYAHKACVKAGVSPAGIDIALKPTASAGGVVIRKLQLVVTFPDDFPEALIAPVLASIDECPVKEMIRTGDTIEFSVQALRAEAGVPA